MTSGDKVARTWDVPPAVACGVRAWADRLGCWDSDLAGQLLAFALAELDAGRLTLERRAVLFELRGVTRGRRYARAKNT